MPSIRMNYLNAYKLNVFSINFAHNLVYGKDN